MRLRHAVPRSRRGVELAINTVVVLILGILIVGGGIAMVATIVREGGKLANETSDAQLRELDLLYDQGYLVAIAPKSVRVSAGDTASVAIGIKSILKTPETFTVSVAATGPDGTPVPLGTQVGSWRSQYFSTVEVVPDKTTAYAVAFTPPDTAARGTYTFIVTLKRPDGSVYDSPRAFTIAVG